MPWEICTDYRGIVGGSYFKNVASIVSFDQQSLLTIKRDSASGDLAVDTDLVDQSGNVVAEVRNNEINVVGDRTDLAVASLGSRISLSNSSTGEILFDFRTNPNGSAYEFELALSSFLPNGLPFYLHPNRIRIGSSRILKPSLAFLNIELQGGSTESAISVLLAPNADSFEGSLLPNTFRGEESILRNFVFEFDPHAPKPVTTFVAMGDSKSIINLNEPAYLLDLGIVNFPIGITVSEPNIANAAE